MNGATEQRSHACPWRDCAPLHVLGLTGTDESARYVEHLEHCGACRAEYASAQDEAAQVDLARAREDAAHLAPPSAAVRERLLGAVAADAASEARVDRTWRRWTASEPDGASHEGLSPGLYAVAAGAGLWERIGIDGIEVKRLAADERRRVVTMLIRMAPGTAYPRHRHAAVEECFVVSGELKVGQRQLSAGDYQLSAEGSVHDVQSTATGCLLLITSSQDDELVD
ncbi:MAG: cupin domain-containing protein [Planctomycetes bacterium]|nr:cupin domain-containing protein [Planctomycetota bacterium]